MLYGLEPGLQKCFERHGAYEMFQELKLVFQTYARVERYETLRDTEISGGRNQERASSVDG